MEDQHSIPAIEEAFERIINRKLFKRSSLQERILRFLVDEYLAGNDVTEHTIGIELFKDKYTANQNDSKVRVYIYYLRKKLAEYYTGVGKDEQVVFQIKKGQYNLSFTQLSEKDPLPQEHMYIHLKIPKKKSLFTLIGVFALIGLWCSLQYYQTDTLWQPFFQRNTVCIIADHFMVADRTNKNNFRFSTFRNINSKLDVNNYKTTHPNLDLIPASFTMTTKMATFSIHYLNRWFNKNDETFDIQLESDTQYSDYTKTNIIYVGQAKKMQESKTFFLHTSKVFTPTKNGYTHQQEGKTTYYIGTHNETKDEEYAMVSFQKLNNGMFNLFFVSNHDIGVMSTIKLFTNPNRLNTFLAKLPNPTTEFNALFKVSGLQRTEMSCELVVLEIPYL